MSVGKDSILRAANADAKKTEVKVETKPAEEVKAAAKAEAAPAAKKAPTKKTAAKKTTAARKTTRKAPAKKWETFGRKEKRCRREENSGSVFFVMLIFRQSCADDV